MKKGEYTLGQIVLGGTGVAALGYGIYSMVNKYSTRSTGGSPSIDKAQAIFNRTSQIIKQGEAQGQNNAEIMTSVFDNIQGISTLTDFINQYDNVVKNNPIGLRPEVVYAMAKLESSDNSGNFGAVPQAAQANNYFGIIADRSWQGDTFRPTDGSGPFRAYDSVEDGLADLFAFLRPYNITATDSAGQIQQISNKGYGGGPQWAGLANGDLLAVLKVYNPYSPANLTASIGGYAGIAAVVVGTGLIGAVLFSGKKKKGLSGAASDIVTWIENNPGTVAIGAGVLVALGIGYYAGKPKDDQGGTQDLDVTKSNLTDPTGAKYKIIADNLYGLFKNGVFAPSVSSIANALAGLNTDELKAVVKAYGTRAYDPAGLQTGNLFETIQAQTGGPPFVGWSDSDVNTIKAIFAPTGLWN